MATPWSQVIQSPAYKALDPDAQEAARQQYFAQVISPQLPDEASRSAAKQQFDQQTGRAATPFGQGVEAEAAKMRTSDTPSFGQQLGDASLRALRSVNESIGGTVDLLSAPIRRGWNLVAGPGYQMGSLADASNQAFQNLAPNTNFEPQSTAERYANAIERGLGGAATGMGVGGALAGSASPAAAAVGRGLLTNPGAQAAAATSGSVTAQAAKDAGLGPMGQIAAGIGGALIPGAAQGVVGLVNNIGVRPFTQAGRQALNANYLGNIAGGPLVVQRSSVPGVNPTLAEATTNPGISQLQRALQNQPENVADFANLAAQNNAARQNFLAKAMGSPEDIQALQQARQEGSAGLYDLAKIVDKTQRGDAQRVIANANAAETAKAEQQAQMLEQQAANLRNQGRLAPGQQAAYESAANQAEAKAAQVRASAPSYELGGNPDIQALAQRPAMQMAINVAKQQMANEGRPVTNPLMSVDGLQYVKVALDRMLNAAPGDSLAKFGRSAVAGIKNDLMDATNQLSPAFQAANARYAELSKPITAMQVGQAIVDRGTGNLTDPNTGLSSLRPNAFAAAVDRGDQIAQQVTGQKNATMASTLAPEQQQALGAVQGDLNRVAYAQNAGRAIGSNTAQNILSSNALDNISQAIGMPGLANTKIAQAVLKPLDKIYNLFGVGDDLKGMLTRVMLNPSSPEAQQVLSQIPVAQRQQLTNTATPYINALRQVQQTPGNTNNGQRRP